MLDYEKLIDDEIWDFIRRTQHCFPDDATNRSIEQQRVIYNQMCRVFSRGRPEGVSVSNAVIEGDKYQVPVRRYRPNSVLTNTIIIYIHGGGYVVGDLDSHDDICAELCVETGLNVTSVDYRLSPENKHPAAFNDCLACVAHEAKHSDAPIILCGDSAGGNLAAAVAYHVSSSKNDSVAMNLIGQVLIYPELGGDRTVGSHLVHANAPMLNASEVSFYLNSRVGNKLPLADPSFAPLQASRFANLPTTLVISAQCDPLSDDGRHYCDAIVKAGGEATWVNEAGLVHGFLRARHTSERANLSFKKIISAMKKWTPQVLHTCALNTGKPS